MGFVCLYVLIQKSGQKTAKSHLCAMLMFISFTTVLKMRIETINIIEHLFGMIAYNFYSTKVSQATKIMIAPKRFATVV